LRALLFFLLLFLVFLLFTSLDSVASGFDPVHDPSNRHRVLTRVIPTSGNTLLNHGKDILASGEIPSIVGPF